MKITRANWFISLAITAFLSVGLLSGCQQNNDTNPTTLQQQQDPSTIDLQHAIDIQNRYTDQVMSIAGVNGTGVGLEGSTPVVYVFTQTENVTGIPTKLEDVKTHVEYIGEVKAFGGKPSSGYTGTYRGPVPSGVSTGNDKECASGTIACVVKDASDNYYFLSNNHVFARENAAAIGEREDQPGRYDKNCGASGQIASLSNFIAINLSGGNNTVDCAIAQVSSGISATTTSAAGYTPSTTTVNPAVNMAVKKTGRTTGLTSGSISAINVTVNVGYDAGTGKFVGQVYIPGKVSAAGDSGSLFVTNNNTQNPVALLFAGSTNSTIANPINAVLSALNVSIVPSTPIGY